MKLVIKIMHLSQYPTMSSKVSNNQAVNKDSGPEDTPQDGGVGGEESGTPQNGAHSEDLGSGENNKRPRLPSFSTEAPTSKNLINVYTRIQRLLPKLFLKLIPRQHKTLISVRLKRFA
jgi:hypothetical protein